MSQVEESGTVPAAEVSARRGLTARTRVIGAAVLAVAAVLGAYAWGTAHPKVRTDEVVCLSVRAQIGCTMSDGFDVAVPTDVAWTDVRGAWHENGRPRCLPPTGIGATGPVRIHWLPVEADGVSWRQVVAVTCLDSAADGRNRERVLGGDQ